MSYYDCNINKHYFYSNYNHITSYLLGLLKEEFFDFPCFQISKEWCDYHRLDFNHYLQAINNLIDLGFVETDDDYLIDSYSP